MKEITLGCFLTAVSLRIEKKPSMKEITLPKKENA